MPHIHELYDFAVSIFVVHANKVLLVNHPRYDKWLAPGGHVELNEDPEEALFRELAEETGLTDAVILSSKPTVESPGTKSIFQPNFMDVHEANSPHKHIGLIYFAKASSNKARLSTEHTDLRWFSRADLHKASYRLDPRIIFYAEQALGLARQT